MTEKNFSVWSDRAYEDEDGRFCHPKTHHGVFATLDEAKEFVKQNFSVEDDGRWESQDTHSEWFAGNCTTSQDFRVNVLSFGQADGTVSIIDWNSKEAF